jgi:hypothetical protein
MDAFRGFQAWATATLAHRLIVYVALVVPIVIAVAWATVRIGALAAPQVFGPSAVVSGAVGGMVAAGLLWLRPKARGRG